MRCSALGSTFFEDVGIRYEYKRIDDRRRGGNYDTRVTTCRSWAIGTHISEEFVPLNSIIVSQVVLTQPRQKREPNSRTQNSHYQ